MYIVVCYDISDNSQRTRLHELLLGYGTPVQRSVFECDLTPIQLRRLCARARPFARSKWDSIRYYQLCSQCCDRTQSDGTPLVEAGTHGDFIV